MTSYDQEITKMVNAILHSKFEVANEKMTPNAHLKQDLELDSLDFVDMFIILEEKIGRTPENIDFPKIQTLGDIYQLVTDLRNQAQQA